jgi:transposase InsO family protein
MREKLEVTKHFKVFVAQTELETSHSLKALRSDGGGEYTAGEMQQFIKDKGIKHEMTTADTLQHNRVMERMNRTLVKRVRTMLIDAALPESYWEYALHYAALLHNISPSRSLDQATSEEAWSGNKPNVSRLRTFSCRAFVHIPNSQ